LLSPQSSTLITRLTPDFVVVGNLTRDEHRDGDTLGGTATYGAITARNLGYRAGILTRAAEDLPQRELLHDIEIERLPSDRTTTFRNLYDEHGHRQQFVHDVADPIDPTCLPAPWRSARIALLGPIAREVETGTAREFDAQTLIGVVPQGWLRQWDETGRVRVRPWVEAPEILPQARVLVLSDEDLGEFTERLQAYTALTSVVVLTHGARGCTVFQRGKKPFDSPAFQAQEVDPTGAGDVFATAFLIRLHETNDLVQAARFANCTASFVIQAVGTLGIPTRQQVEQRLREGRVIESA
jgi:sugar/nucleoside kinase (ribokinase family)